MTRRQYFLLIVLFLIGFALSQSVDDNAIVTQQEEAPIPPAAEQEESNLYKYYFSIFEVRTLFGLLMLGTMMVFCTLGGIGGNIVILPVCLIFFKFDPHLSVAHTSFFSTLSAATRVFIEMKLQPENKRINFDVVLISCVPTVLGTFLGVYLNRTTPDVIIMALTCLLLSYLLRKSFFEYKARAKKEDDDVNHLNTVVIPELGRMFLSKKTIELELLGEQNRRSIDRRKKEKEELLLVNGKVHDQYIFETSDLKYYALILVLNPLYSLLKGNSEHPSILGLEKCGSGQIVLVIIYAASLFFFLMHLKHVVNKRNEQVVEHDLNVDFKGGAQNKILLIMVLVGLVGAFLSAGASALITFSLIMLEMTPFTASPTALLAGIVFGSSGSIMYYWEGLIFMSAAIVGGLVVIACTAGVRLTIYQSFLQSGKSSIILLFISIMMGFGVIASIAVVGPIVYKQSQRGINIWAFKSLC